MTTTATVEPTPRSLGESIALTIGAQPRSIHQADAQQQRVGAEQYEDRQKWIAWGRDYQAWHEVELTRISAEQLQQLAAIEHERDAARAALDERDRRLAEWEQRHSSDAQLAQHWRGVRAQHATDAAIRFLLASGVGVLFACVLWGRES